MFSLGSEYTDISVSLEYCNKQVILKSTWPAKVVSGGHGDGRGPTSFFRVNLEEISACFNAKRTEPAEAIGDTAWFLRGEQVPDPREVPWGVTPHGKRGPSPLMRVVWEEARCTSDFG